MFRRAFLESAHRACCNADPLGNLLPRDAGEQFPKQSAANGGKGTAHTEKYALAPGLLETTETALGYLRPPHKVLP